jgi:hypothetical protein
MGQQGIEVISVELGDIGTVGRKLARGAIATQIDEYIARQRVEVRTLGRPRPRVEGQPVQPHHRVLALPGEVIRQSRAVNVEIPGLPFGLANDGHHAYSRSTVG